MGKQTHLSDPEMHVYLEPQLVAFEINHPVFIRLAPCFEKNMKPGETLT